MNKVADLLRQKGNTVHHIDAHATVFEALEKMVQWNIGSVVVYDGDQFVGIFTERDYARKVILRGKASKKTAVGEIMVTNPITISMEDTIDECMYLMLHHKIRYLPVLIDGYLVGIVAMGDLVNFIMEDQQNTIQNLQNYIAGT